MGLPYRGMSKYICIGLNYTDHAREAGLEKPAEPVIFLKAISALCGPDDELVQPFFYYKVYWEL